MWNATRHVAGLAALRGSTLQLLESLEALETKVDASVPAVQREISRLEFSLAQVRAVAHENKEDMVSYLPPPAPLPPPPSHFPIRTSP